MKTSEEIISKIHEIAKEILTKGEDMDWQVRTNVLFAERILTGLIDWIKE